MAGKSPNTPTDKGSVVDPNDGKPTPNGEEAARMSRGPAGTQLGDSGEIKLPEGATEDTRKEATAHFRDKHVVGPGANKDLEKTGREGVREAMDRFRSAQNDNPVRNDSHDKVKGDECKARYTDAIEQIAAATKKLTESGLGGAEAGRIAFTCWQSCNGFRD